MEVYGKSSDEHGPLDGSVMTADVLGENLLSLFGKSHCIYYCTIVPALDLSTLFCPRLV